MIKNITNKETRQFAMAWCIVLSAISISKYLKGEIALYPKVLVGAVSLFLLGIFLPVVLKPLLLVLKTIFKAVLWCITTVMLILVYYFVFVPIGLIMRLSGKDVLNVEIDKSAETYWKCREITRATRESLERQY
jgi:hypothetical protein